VVGLGKPTKSKWRLDLCKGFTTEDEGQPPPKRIELPGRAARVINCHIFLKKCQRIVVFARILCIFLHHFMCSKIMSLCETYFVERGFVCVCCGIFYCMFTSKCVLVYDSKSRESYVYMYTNVHTYVFVTLQHMYFQIYTHIWNTKHEIFFLFLITQQPLFAENGCTTGVLSREAASCRWDQV